MTHQTTVPLLHPWGRLARKVSTTVFRSHIWLTFSLAACLHLPELDTNRQDGGFLSRSSCMPSSHSTFTTVAPPSSPHPALPPRGFLLEGRDFPLCFAWGRVSLGGRQEAGACYFTQAEGWFPRDAPASPLKNFSFSILSRPLCPLQLWSGQQFFSTDHCLFSVIYAQFES